MPAENLTSLNFEALIGGPMSAAISAQAQAAKTTIDFIQEVGFEGTAATPDDSFGTVRNVQFQYASNDGGSVETNTLDVPILSIVPIPYLRIENMDINFKASITDVESFTGSVKSEFGVDLSAKGGFFGSRYKFKAHYKRESETTRSSSSTVKYEYEVNVRAVQDDIPAGLSRVLDILENSIIDSSETTGTGAGTGTE